MARASLICVALFAASCAVTATPLAVDDLELVPTPYGIRPKRCVVEVPDGSHVDEDEFGLVVTHPALGTIRHTADPLCSLPEYAPRPSMHMYQALAVPPPHMNRSVAHCDIPPCTCDSLPCNNWIDNAGYMTGDTFIGGMSSVMTVPDSPPKGFQDAQTLFYFIGAENTDGMPRHGAPPPSGRAILQPVLTYAPKTNCNGKTKTGWCIASWYCCPKNLTTHSTYLMDVKPGDKWIGLYNLTTPGEDGVFTTVSQNVATGENTTLSCPRQGRNFNWADVTLEVYGIDTCSEFAEGPMTFSDVKLWDTDMKSINVPEHEWLLTSPNKPGLCEGQIKLSKHTSGDGDSFTIQHTPGPDGEK